MSKSLTKHGYSLDPYFKTFSRIYTAMNQRCLNKNNIRYDSYGGTGIIVCSRWQNLTNFAIDMFPKYKELAVLGDGTKSMRPSIDRIDSFGDYSPESCEWIIYGENSTKDKRIPVIRMDYEGNILEVYELMSDVSMFSIPFVLKIMKATLSNIHDCYNVKNKIIFDTNAHSLPVKYQCKNMI